MIIGARKAWVQGYLWPWSAGIRRAVIIPRLYLDASITSLHIMQFPTSLGHPLTHPPFLTNRTLLVLYYS